MKKLLLALLIAALTLAAGCSRGGAPVEAEPETAQPTLDAAPEMTPAPESASPEMTPESDPTLAPVETVAPQGGDAPASETASVLVQPTEAPSATDPGDEPAPTGTPAAVQLSAVYQTITSDSLGYQMNYPEGWVNKPGRHTLCYQQAREDGGYPARAAFTIKTVKHTPESAEDVTNQLKSFLVSISASYEKDDFSVGGLDSAASLLGQAAFATTYVTTSGNTEVKGYAVATAIGRKICIFHFSCAYDDYASLEGIRANIQSSIAAYSADQGT